MLIVRQNNACGIDETLLRKLKINQMTVLNFFQIFFFHH